MRLGPLLGSGLGAEIRGECRDGDQFTGTNVVDFVA
jgi:hypothetical protein